jgi:hypothetical protein
METAIQNLPNLLEKVKIVEDLFIIQALFRGYAFLATAYLV